MLDSCLLTDEEKGALVAGLKAKWEKVNTDYQATTHITKLDTIGKLHLRERRLRHRGLVDGLCLLLLLLRIHDAGE